jgi:hypothetical protein
MVNCAPVDLCVLSVWIFEKFSMPKLVNQCVIYVGQPVGEELEEIFEDVLAAEEARAAREITVGSFFAYSSPESD